uniref:Uncharacterized protein n=1 Tax=Globodera pallida TaxID=36090 RepID=A0A183CLP4_GLOPA
MMRQKWEAAAVDRRRAPGAPRHGVAFAHEQHSGGQPANAGDQRGGFGPIDTAYFEALRDIRREVERWVPRKREMKRLYRVCRQLNRAERIEISKLIDAFLNGKSVDRYLEKRQKKVDKASKEKGRRMMLN